MNTKCVHIGIVGLGVNESEGTDATGVVAIAECCSIVASNIHSMEEIAIQSSVSFGYEIKDEDTTFCSLYIKILAMYIIHHMEVT